MKERPILFSTEMVKAILEGRKTQTRRVLRDTTEHRGEQYNPAYIERWKNDEGWAKICPYGKVGDRLWVRETFCDDCIQDPVPHRVCYKANRENQPASDFCTKWKPSIFMPRWASRITLEITNIRVERVQDIGVKDALAEGVKYDVSVRGGDPVSRYQDLWDSINGEKYPWSSNPWVWVIEFKRI